MNTQQLLDSLQVTRGSAIDCPIPPTIQRWLHQVLDRLPLNLEIDFWGHTVLSSHHADSAAIVFRIRHPGVLRKLLLSQDPLTLADAYLQGWIDVEGDLATVLALVQQHPHARVTIKQFLQAWIEAWSLPNLPSSEPSQASWKTLRFRTRDRDRAAVQHHYDAGNEFYKLWLDPQLVYSCAYFEHPHMSLQDAQAAKLDRICRKLKLSPGETLLDIGCGWGSLMQWAVTHYGVKAHGITLSKEQFVYNQERITAAGLNHQITVELLDYRDLPKAPLFDKIVSVGMVEHVGAENYPAYFQNALAALKPNGLFLNHGIATRDRWNDSSIGERFIDRYIFPDGRLTLLNTQLTAAETAGWEIVDVDNWR
ncbi:MAG TPA: cyclopropane-fatty-acyl-phospholipid synthase family protein, partial [Leptolyngbya sp.]|nr:cyclopropane-fatty-acyl-phospholipid synthase family protein [Leptolyngbya sp.]